MWAGVDRPRVREAVILRAATRRERTSGALK
jgi:hypothetical protein